MIADLDPRTQFEKSIPRSVAIANYCLGGPPPPPEVPDRNHSGMFGTRDLRFERSGRTELDRSLSGRVDGRAAALFFSVVITELPADPPDLTSALPPGAGGLADIFSFVAASSSGMLALAPVPAILSTLPSMTGRPSLPPPMITIFEFLDWASASVASMPRQRRYESEIP